MLMLMRAASTWHARATPDAGRRAVRMLREELQLLQEPGSHVGEVIKAMGKTKVLVKVRHAQHWQCVRWLTGLRAADRAGGEVRRGHRQGH